MDSRHKDGDGEKVDKYVQHNSWAWPDKVNFIIHIDGEYDPGFVVREQLGTRMVSPNTVELCCLPFYLYGYSLGDIIEISPTTYKFIQVVEKSGRWLYRFMFSCRNSEVIEIADDLKARFGVIFEWYNSTFCAVDFARGEVRKEFVEHLSALREAGKLEFERANGTPS